MSEISRLHYITQDNVFGYTHAQLAEEVCMGGADWIQLRVKKKGYNDWKNIALETQEVCKKYNAKLIINDNVRIAKEIGADGVHLGKEDMLPEAARDFLGNDFIIGVTANTLIDIEGFDGSQIDYIGLGPFRFTETKENLSPVLGLDGYLKIIKICRETNISAPIIAIGGIKLGDIKDLFTTGIHGVAVSSAINGQTNKEEEIKKYIKNIKGLTENKNETINNRR